MRTPLLVTLALSAACASGGGGVGGQNDQSIHVGTGASGMLRVRGEGARTASLAYPLERVWRVLPSVFDSLGIALTDLDPATHILGNSGMKVHTSLGGVALTKYLDCGSAQGYQSAETYDIQMSIKSGVESTGDGGSTVATMIEAAGRPMAFAGEYVRCTSKGELENAIVARVKQLLH